MMPIGTAAPMVGILPRKEPNRSIPARSEASTNHRMGPVIYCRMTDNTPITTKIKKSHKMYSKSFG